MRIVPLLSGSRGLFAVLLTLLLAVRGMVPVGYMLDRSPEDGAIIIRMCGGVHERLLAFDPATGAMTEVDASDEDVPQTPANEDDATASCPFALTAVFDLPPLTGETLLGLFGPPLLSGKPVLAPLKLRAEGPALPARGPPAWV